MILLISLLFNHLFLLSQENKLELEKTTIYDFLGSWYGEGNINYHGFFDDNFDIEVIFRNINTKQGRKLVSTENSYKSKAKKLRLTFEGNFSFKETEEDNIYLVDVNPKNNENIKLQMLFSKGQFEILNYFNGVIYFLNKNKLAFKIYYIDKEGKKIIQASGILHRKFKNIKDKKINKNKENKTDTKNINIEKKIY